MASVAPLAKRGLNGVEFLLMDRYTNSASRSFLAPVSRRSGVLTMGSVAPTTARSCLLPLLALSDLMYHYSRPPCYIRSRLRTHRAEGAWQKEERARRGESGARERRAAMKESAQHSERKNMPKEK